MASSHPDLKDVFGMWVGPTYKILGDQMAKKLSSLTTFSSYINKVLSMSAMHIYIY